MITIVLKIEECPSGVKLTASGSSDNPQPMEEKLAETLTTGLEVIMAQLGAAAGVSTPTNN
jgi:hypothetical protein